MSDDYVSRKAVRDILSALAIRHFELSDLFKIYIKALEDADAEILKIPTADVAPVIRCKDCSYIHAGKDVYYCRYWEKWGLTPDGFCSCGARMDGEA